MDNPPQPDAENGAPPERLYVRHVSPVRADAPQGNPATDKIRAQPLPPCTENLEDLERDLERLAELAPAGNIAKVRHDLAILRNTLQTYRDVRAEEQANLEVWNEDARTAEMTIDARLEALRDERAKIESRNRDAIDSARERYRVAQEHEIAARASVGEDVSGLAESLAREASPFDTDFGDSNGTPSQDAPSANEGLGGAGNPAVQPEAPSNRPRLSFRFGRKPVVPPTAPSPDTATPPGGAPDAVPGANSASGSRDEDSGPTRWLVGDIEPDVAVRARPLEAFAVEHGLPVRWFAEPTQTPLASWVDKSAEVASRLLGWVSPAVFGTLFGLSLGQILGLLDLRPMLLSGDFETAKLVPAALAGTVVFAAIGKAIRPTAVFYGELWANGVAANPDGIRPGIAKILTAKAFQVLLCLCLIAVLLVTVEATVESQGLVKTFLEQNLNRSLASGKAPAAPRPPSVWETQALVLSIILPYVLQLATGGWIHGATSAFRNWLVALRTAEIAQIRREIHEREEARLAETNSILMERHHQNLRETMEPKSPPASTPDWSSSLPRWDSEAQDTEDEPAGRVDSEDEFGLGESPRSWEDESPSTRTVDPRYAAPQAAVSSPKAMAGIALVRRKDALSNLKIVYNRAKKDLATINQEIARWEQRRTEERKGLDEVSIKRIDAAYAAVVTAATQFERSFRRLANRCDRLGRRDIPARIHRMFLDDPKPRG
jgi:hypothetical protein